jgi:hypothetical protein
METIPTPMPPRPATPRDLVEALQNRAEGARDHLWQLLREPLGRLMGELRKRHGLGLDEEHLTLHALHAAETWLRTRPAGAFAGTSWPAFRAGLLLHVARLASLPFGQESAPAASTQARSARDGTAVGPQPLPSSPSYHSETLFLPHQQVGNYWFGGDWFAGQEAADGSLWVIVADITGHGYYAYLLASALPGVWQACWNAARPAQPAELLAAMHDLLQECLPEGVYVECTLVRLGPKGEAVVAPAGGSRLLVRRGRGRPDLLKLRGSWLGLSPPTAADQRTWTLDDGDELLLGSDGVFDQLADRGEAAVVEHLGRTAQGGTLIEGVRDLLHKSLASGPQKDDITAVLLLRRPRPAATGGSPVAARNLQATGGPPVAADHEAGNV